MAPLEARLKDHAHSLDFSLVGIARAAEADGFARLSDWLARGFAGEMAYMHRHADARRHPAAVLPEVRSVVMVGMEYGERLQASGSRPQEEYAGKERLQASGFRPQEEYAGKSPSLKPSPGSSCRLLSRSTEPVQHCDLGRPIARSNRQQKTSQ